MRIDPRARIAVPVPDAPHVGTGLKQAHFETFLPQAVKLIDAIESRSDNEGIEYLGIVIFLRLAGL
jgi:hypothetical protein